MKSARVVFDARQVVFDASEVVFEVSEVVSDAGRIVPGAGGVVFDPQGRVLLIAYPASRGGGWSFPKGHIDPGETPEVAAVREVLEEGGVDAQIVGSLETTRYVNPRGVAREIYWFAMRTLDVHAMPEPGFRAGFFSPKKTMKMLSHLDNRDLLGSAQLVLS